MFPHMLFLLPPPIINHPGHSSGPGRAIFTCDTVGLHSSLFFVCWSGHSSEVCLCLLGNYDDDDDDDDDDYYYYD